MKRSKIGSFAEMWMNLETVIQSDVRREKQTLYINAYGGGLIAKSCLTPAAPWAARLLCP